MKFRLAAYRIVEKEANMKVAVAASTIEIPNLVHTVVASTAVVSIKAMLVSTIRGHIIAGRRAKASHKTSIMGFPFPFDLPCPYPYPCLHPLDYQISLNVYVDLDNVHHDSDVLVRNTHVLCVANVLGNREVRVANWYDDKMVLVHRVLYE